MSVLWGREFIRLMALVSRLQFATFLAFLNMLKNRHFFGGESPLIVGRQNALKTAPLA